MKIEKCLELLSAEFLVPPADDASDIEITDVVVSDLMSDVLVTEREDFLLVTSLTSEQVVRTGDIVGARAILITNGKHPQPAMLDLARSHNLPVMRTNSDTFGVSKVLAGCLDQHES